MSFEINRCEGRGRLGIWKEREFETPTFTILRSTSFQPLQSDILGFTQIPPLKTIQSNLSAKAQPANTIDLSQLPICHVYPTLQGQGKSLPDITQISDFFPGNKAYESLSHPSFHLIPWDLPTIHLDRFSEYITILNNLEEENSSKNLQLILNVPLRREIFDNDLPEITAESIVGVSLGDISSVLSNPNLFIKYIHRIRSWVSPRRLLYAPGIPITYIPILVYLGVDVFDFLQLELISANNLYQSSVVFDQNPSLEQFIDVLERTRNALKGGILRDMVRVFANAYPPLKAILRRIDRNIPLEGTPLYRTHQLLCTDETDFTRPEVSFFRERVRSRYTPPSFTQGIIFLPCSAKKPYSASKSHQRFNGVIKRTLKRRRHVIKQVIITSPLGVVPRELEYTYPAGHYDIPVTDYWMIEEKKHVIQDLISLLSKLDSSLPLVGFVTGTDREVLVEACDQVDRAIHLVDPNLEKLTSPEGLHQFSALLRETFSEVTVKQAPSSRLTFLRTIADFQFGKGAGLLLLPDHVRISGHQGLGLRVRLEGKHLVTFRPETGLLTLSLAAGERMSNHTNNVVVFDGERIQGSTIFALGISHANPAIRPNEEVLIVNKDGRLIAIGTSYLPGPLLVEMNRGKGIKIRQKVK
jgi:archaeosine synthase